MVYGYDIQSRLTYYRLLDDLYLSKNSKWRRVTSQTAPVGETLQDTLKLANENNSEVSDDVDVPLVLTNLTIEYNRGYTFIRKGRDDAERERYQLELEQGQNQQQQDTTPTTPLEDVTSPIITIDNDNENEGGDSLLLPSGSYSKVTESTTGFIPRRISSYAIIRNAISGYQLLTDKFNLTRNLMNSNYLVPCILIERSQIIDAYQIDIEKAKLEKDKVWFLKDPLLNKSQGIELFNSIDDALAHCNPKKRYILQREIIPSLINNFKFDVRINVLFVFTATSKRLYMFNEGVIRCTNTKYKDGSLDKQQQFTNFCYQLSLNPEFDNIMPLSEWDRDGSRFKELEGAVLDVFKPFWSRLNFLKHSGFTLLGLDFIFDRDDKPYLLEVNYSPSMFIQSHEKVASICRRAISQLPYITLEPLLEGKPYATDTDWNLIRSEIDNSENNNNNVDEDFDLFN
ncbi:hypothetical protein PPL_02921 [Heterostelium album PN500]|uniref:Tubulin--tyrosine ligase n=1 Tax=Heterostelium pallidum (strain ATCC 26659 / Pp 5 / PN500) TaxID=670386 RepID=D3B3F3_HETP5|nr:hypothetical protein PPL_02921 [Heterostelium album PN500]EFA83851.1 hypothetical protein PPL_02921 [Heterostelium album PN500]|eukprot:XP_020435968.1 hypothetical protein PPL_02921 [Heterostelium album PN500]